MANSSDYNPLGLPPPPAFETIRRESSTTYVSGAYPTMAEATKATRANWITEVPMARNPHMPYLDIYNYGNALMEYPTHYTQRPHYHGSDIYQNRYNADEPRNYSELSYNGEKPRSSQGVSRGYNQMDRGLTDTKKHETTKDYKPRYESSVSKEDEKKEEILEAIKSLKEKLEHLEEKVVKKPKKICNNENKCFLMMIELRSHIYSFLKMNGRLLNLKDVRDHIKYFFDKKKYNICWLYHDDKFKSIEEIVRCMNIDDCDSSRKRSIFKNINTIRINKVVSEFLENIKKETNLDELSYYDFFKYLARELDYGKDRNILINPIHT